MTKPIIELHLAYLACKNPLKSKAWANQKIEGNMSMMSRAHKKAAVKWNNRVRIHSHNCLFSALISSKNGWKWIKHLMLRVRGKDVTEHWTLIWLVPQIDGRINIYIYIYTYTHTALLTSDNDQLYSFSSSCSHTEYSKHMSLIFSSHPYFSLYCLVFFLPLLILSVSSDSVTAEYVFLKIGVSKRDVWI